MKPSFLNSLQNAVNHWYIPLLVGILFVIVSVVVFTSPISSLITLSMLFALSFIIGGLSEIIFSITNRDRLDNWGWSLAFGIITFLVGTSLFMHPELSISVLAFYIGFLLLFRSISSISFAMDIKKYGSKNWASLLIFGILGAIVSFILIWNPLFAGMSIIILVALSFLFTGVFSILLSFQLRRIHKHSNNISTHLRKRYDELMEEINKESRI